jgi:putative membrane protein
MSSFKPILAATLLSLLSQPAVSVAQDNNASAMAVDKTKFVTMATSSNMLEIQSSEIALQRASSSDVKAFANQMIQDHTKAGQEMTAVLEQQGMTPPKELTAPHAKMLKDLTDTNSNFDAAYLQMQQAAHVEAVGLFQAYSGKPDDQALGAFAQKTLPTLQMHLDHVTKLNTGK